METFNQDLNQLVRMTREHLTDEIRKSMIDREKEGLIINKEIIEEILTNLTDK